MFTGKAVCVFDIETAESADDLPTGWKNKAALGISVGCYYDYRDGKIHWFDQASVADVMRRWVEEQPLLVGFNSIGFDAALMRAVLRYRGDGVGLGEIGKYHDLHDLCDQFKELASNSYDILAEVWSVAGRNTERGLNSLDAILEANGLEPKIGHGAQAPRDWKAGQYARVLNYNQDDVYKTKELFELICDRGGYLKRRSDELWLRTVCTECTNIIDINGDCKVCHQATTRP